MHPAAVLRARLDDVEGIGDGLAAGRLLLNAVELTDEPPATPPTNTSALTARIRTGVASGTTIVMAASTLTPPVSS